MQYYILKRYRPTKRTGIWYLCLNKKLFIIEHQGNNLLNQKNKLISKCRQKNKFRLMNHKTWSLCEKCPCSELLLLWIFSRIWTEYGELQTKSQYWLRMWRNTSQTNLECQQISRSGRQNIATLFWYHCIANFLW